jgi:hypothetical protein
MTDVGDQITLGTLHFSEKIIICSDVIKKKPLGWLSKGDHEGR